MMTQETEQAVPPNGEDEALVQQIATTLQEPYVELVRKVVKGIGAERAKVFFAQTLETEAAGGLMTRDNSKRRTPGGTFFFLVKRGIPSSERKGIFPAWSSPQKQNRPNKEHGQTSGSAEPAPVLNPPTWEEAKGLVEKAIQKTGEAKTVKITLIGRPTQVTKTQTCVVIALKSKGPPSLPKGLPTPPEGSAFSFAVFIANKQWDKVKDSIQKHADDELIIEGYPIMDPKRGVSVVLAQNCISKMQQRAERENKQARPG